MPVLKLDGTGGTDVVLHYIPVEAVAGFVVLYDPDAGCYCLDATCIDPGATEEEDQTYQLTVASSKDVNAVIRVADTLAEQIWGSIIAPLSATEAEGKHLPQEGEDHGPEDVR